MSVPCIFTAFIRRGGEAEDGGESGRSRDKQRRGKGWRKKRGSGGRKREMEGDNINVLNT